ncbi:MAG: L-threonylcarbamoyladenylate synthase [Patescibacteria group bacterium]
MKDLIFLKNDIKKIAANFKKGKIGIFPTDTIYGMGGRADKPAVIKKIYYFKKRDKNKPLLILVNSIAMAKKYVKISQIQEKTLRNFWPAKLTVIFKSKNILPKEITGGTDKIGVRLPDDKFLAEIIKKLAVPLIATSANISGGQNVLDIQNIKIKSDFIVDGGKLPESKPSTIIDFTGENIKILRKGDVDIK